ncbi:MAG: multicopper oxidase domain-containing protein [Thermoflexales bacterium]|nr:multicopper oxidase domain-containing protein [Thermoflexales bacterium]
MKVRVSPVIGIPLTLLGFLAICAVFNVAYTAMFPTPKPTSPAVAPAAQPVASDASHAAAPTAKPVAVAAAPVGAGAQVTTPQKVEGELLGTLVITGIDIAYSQGNFMVDNPGRYKIRFVNKGSILHDVTFPNGIKIEAKAGETVEQDIMVPPNGLTFICSIPGHKDAGMIGAISVKGNAAAANASGGDSHGGPAPAADVLPDPKAPNYVLYKPDAPKRLEGTVHDIDLVIEEKTMVVAKGFVQAVWTFGGTVPGPVIRVKVGDTIRIHLKNPKTSKLPHSVDFHASMVAWNDEMTSINPGEEKLYEWKADYAGVWMYHCGTAPALHHIANGMYGMVIVEPKEGLPPVDAEFAFVQSEWYLGPQGEPASLLKAAAAAPAPDYVVFNGVASQYADNPIQINTNKRIRAYVLNAGPSVDSSFHIVGTIFDTVIKEGVSLTPDNKGKWGSQAVDLSPAQGAIVEFTMAEDGLYPIVTHAFNFVGRGALGLFKAGSGDPKKK